MTNLVLNLRPTLEVTDQQFEQICSANQDLRIERSHQGELVIMSPTGGETGRRNFDLATQFGIWIRQTGEGVGFDSSTGFKLPNGAIKSPDLAWLTSSRWEALTAEQKRKYIPLCPDFAVELRSPTDELRDVQAKMREYISNGLCLGWLIDPETRIVEIYRLNQAVEILQAPVRLSGENVLIGFNLDLAEIFNPI